MNDTSWMVHDYPDPPAETAWPICPCCGLETDTFYRDYHGDIVGCPECIDSVDAWEDET